MDAASPLFAVLLRQPHEVCIVAYFDPDGALLGMRHTPMLDISRVKVPLHHIAADALALRAATVVMAHNHPSGQPSPSAADRAVTRTLARALDSLGVRLADHIIIAGEHSFSLRAAGLL